MSHTPGSLSALRVALRVERVAVRWSLPLISALAFTACGRGGAVTDAAPASDAADATLAPDATPAPDAAPPGPAAHLYVGSGGTVALFEVPAATGIPVYRDTFPAGDEARYADLHPPGGHLYVQSQLGTAYAVLTFDLLPDGSLERAGEVAFPYPTIEGVSQVLVHPTAPWFLISVSHRLAGLEDYLMPIGGAGALGPASVLAREFYGFNWDPSGGYFYGLDGVAISQFRFDAAAGKAEALAPAQAEGSEGRTFLGLEIHPAGRWAYSIEEDAIGIFAFDAATGALTAPTYLPGPVPDEPALWTSVVLAPAGEFLYACGYVAGSRRGLVDVFALDPASGRLRFVEREKGADGQAVLDTGLQAPAAWRDLLIVGGKSAAGGIEKAAIVAYRVEPGGKLRPVSAPQPLPNASSPVISFTVVSER